MWARISLILKGFVMGIADVIPGVSGGTMALVLGIYERLIDAIRSLDLRFARALFTGAFWRRLFSLIFTTREELRGSEDGPSGSAAFIGVLFIGIVAAALTGVRIIPGLLAEHRAPTLGFFFGLVVASVIIPYRMMGRRRWQELVAFLLVTVGTFFLVGLKVDDSANAGGYVMVSVAEPTTEDVRIPAADVRFSTFEHEGNAKREILFAPRGGELVVPKNGTPVKVPIVALMAGSEGNLASSAVSHLLAPTTATDKLRVAQPQALTGGSNPALWYVFLCGAIAISAMILPGISGSFILLLLGQYFYILFTVHEIVYGGELSRLPVLVLFLAGILVGILAFARLLSWLLHHYHSTIMAILVGLMLGSLRKIWPFQTLTVDGTTNRLPSGADDVAIVAGMFLAGLAVVLVLDLVGRKKLTEERG